MPYRLLYDHLPGFQEVRVPARFAVMVELAVSILAGIGVARVLRSVVTDPGSMPRLSRSTVGWIAALLLSVVVLAEDISVPIPLAPYPSGSRLPTVYHWLAVQSPRGVLIELPIDNVSSHAQAYVYFSLFHHWTIVNGWRSFIPPAYHDILKSA